MFRQYHYLSGTLSSGSRCYAATLQDRPVAFIAVLTVKFRTQYYRVSRLVVLPDYQGIGIGKRLLNFVAELYTSQTKLPFMIVTTNPQLVRGSLGKNWIVKRYGHASRMRNTSFSGSAKSLPESTSRNRLTVSLQYNPNI